MDNLHEQFSKIYDEYIDKIYRFVYLKVNSQEIAEDITSKVFLKGFEAYKSSAEPIKNAGAFLYQTARNAVIDHYRSKGRSEVVSAEISPEMVDLSQNIEEGAILKADAAVVKNCINKLTKDQQDVIMLHYLEDIPIVAVAEMMGKPVGTVRVIMHRGLKKLKNIIQES